MSEDLSLPGIISDNPRKTMVAAIVFFCLAAIGGQGTMAFGAIVLFIWGAGAWGDYDRHIAKREYELDRLERELRLHRREIEESYREGLAEGQANRNEHEKRFPKLYAARTNAQERRELG
jgi:flagellar biosynthesis component FlhA